MSTLKSVDHIDTPYQRRIPVFTFGDEPMADPLIHPGYDRESIQAKRDWKGTFAGRALVITQPDPGIVDLFDVACSLSGINRYDGACLTTWDVAIHSYLVALLYTNDCKEKGTAPNDTTTLHLLLHDAHEYATGDVCTPAQFGFEERLPGFRAMLKGLQAEWDVAIRKRFGLPEPTDQEKALIRYYDLLALAIEKHLMCVDQAAPWACDKDFPLSEIKKYDYMFSAINGLLDEDRYDRAETFLTSIFTIANRQPAYMGLRDQALEAISTMHGLKEEFL